jgi:hypothetical protein
MSYNYPDYNALTFSWAGEGWYPYPEYNAANLSFSPPGNLINTVLDSVSASVQVAQGYTQLTSLSGVLEDVGITIEATRSSIYSFNNELIHQGAYTPPLASVANFDFNPPPANFHYPYWDFVLDDVTGIINIAYTMNVSVNATLDDAIVVVSCIPPRYASFDLLLDDAEGLDYAIWAPPVTIDCQLEDTTMVAEGLWFSGVWRGLWTSLGFPQETLKELVDLPVRMPHQETSRLRSAPKLPWVAALATPHTQGISWVVPKHNPVHQHVPWEAANKLATSLRDGYASPEKHHVHLKNPWEVADIFSVNKSSIYSSPPHKDLAADFLFDKSNFKQTNYWFPFGWAVYRQTGEKLPWEVGTPHSWIWGGWPDPPPPPPPPPYVPSPNLEFYQTMLDYVGGAIMQHSAPCYAWPLDYVPEPPPVGPSPGVVIVIHSLAVKRLPDMVNVPVQSISARFDRNSWAWQASLSLQGEAAMDLIKPVSGEPRSVRIEMDGFYLTIMIDEYTKDESFAEVRYNASGKSPLALFTEPYSAVRSYTSTGQATASQLIDYELLNTGWSAQYHSSLSQLFTTDWLVGAGVWSYQNKTRIDALTTIAKAVGARAFADKSLPIVHIEPMYPVSPWNWSTIMPDKTVPEWLIRNQSIQLATRPAYNQVYVLGENQGVGVNAVRDGSGGDIPAPMVTDRLITIVGAGSEAARNILSAAGRQEMVTIDLPINSTTGLLEPGTIVEVQGTSASWRGIVESLDISAQLGAAAQRVTIERHYY